MHKQLVKKNLEDKIFLKKKKSFIASAEKRHWEQVSMANNRWKCDEFIGLNYVNFNHFKIQIMLMQKLQKEQKNLIDRLKYLLYMWSVN